MDTVSSQREIRPQNIDLAFAFLTWLMAVTCLEQNDQPGVVARMPEETVGDPSLNRHSAMEAFQVPFGPVILPIPQGCCYV